MAKSTGLFAPRRTPRRSLLDRMWLFRQELNVHSGRLEGFVDAEKERPMYLACLDGDDTGDGQARAIKVVQVSIPRRPRAVWTGYILLLSPQQTS